MKNQENDEFRITDELAATIIQRLVSDPGAQKSLAERPIETLADWGVPLSESTREKFKNASLEDIYAEQFDISPISAQSEVGLLPAVLVAVATRGTRPVTNTRSKSAVKSGTKSTVLTSTATATKTVFDIRSTVGLPINDDKFDALQDKIYNKDVPKRVLRKFIDSDDDESYINELKDIIEEKENEIRRLKKELSQKEGRDETRSE